MSKLHHSEILIQENYSGDERAAKAADERKFKNTKAKITARSSFAALSGSAASSQCKMAFHMGAMLDVAEKVCEASRQVSTCASSGACSKWSELGSLVASLDARTPEAVWKVCCYRAYKVGGYQSCKNPDATCKQAIEQHVLKHVKRTGLAQKLSLLMAAGTTDLQTRSKAALPLLDGLLNRIQAARGVLWQQGNCKKIMAKPTPASKCGWGTKFFGQEHSIARRDLYCETIEWQYNQMGAGDDYMKRCPGAKTRNAREQTLWEKHQNTIIRNDGAKPVRDFFNAYKPSWAKDEKGNRRSIYAAMYPGQ